MSAGLLARAQQTYGQFSKLGSCLGVLFIRVPYYSGDLKRDPNLENDSYIAKRGSRA